jgi:hypothetical protein
MALLDLLIRFSSKSIGVLRLSFATEKLREYFVGLDFPAFGKSLGGLLPCIFTKLVKLLVQIPDRIVRAKIHVSATPGACKKKSYNRHSNVERHACVGHHHFPARLIWAISLCTFLDLVDDCRVVNTLHRERSRHTRVTRQRLTEIV